MAKYKIYNYSYSFNKPHLLDENSYNQLRANLPIYPQPENINEILLKKYWTYIFALFPPIFIFAVLIPLLYGSFEPLEHAKALKKKNKFFHDYYNSIYNSKNYIEYCRINNTLPKKSKVE